MIILVLVAHAALAAVFPICRAAMMVTTPFFFTAIRKLLAGAILLGYGYKTKQVRLSKLTVVTAFLVVAVAIFGVYLTNIPECWSLQFVPSAKAAFLYSLSPFYAAMLAYVILGERFTFKKMLGMGIGFIGFAITIFKDAPKEIHVGGWWVVSSGEIALIVAAISTALGWMAVHQLVRRGFSSIEVNGITMVLGGGAALLSAPFFESWSPLPILNYGLVAWYLLLAIFFSNLVGYTLYGYLLKKYTTTLLSFAGFSETVFAALYGWLFLGELLTWDFYLSSALVFFGLYIFYSEELRQGYIRQK